jgi:Zn-dependent oligopeptidase
MNTKRPLEELSEARRLRINRIRKQIQLNQEKYKKAFIKNIQQATHNKTLKEVIDLIKSLKLTHGNVMFVSAYNEHMDLLIEHIKKLGRRHKNGNL